MSNCDGNWLNANPQQERDLKQGKAYIKPFSIRIQEPISNSQREKKIDKEMTNIILQVQAP